jgi:leucyl aminopeptidase
LQFKCEYFLAELILKHTIYISDVPNIAKQGITMDFSASGSKVGTLSADCCIVAVFNDGKMSPSAVLVNRLCDGIIQQCLNQEDIKGEIGESLFIPLVNTKPYARLLIVGAGENKELSEVDFRKIANTIASQLAKKKIQTIINTINEITIPTRNMNWRIRQTVIAMENARYQFTECKSKKKEKTKRKKDIQPKMIFLIGQEHKTGIAEITIQETKAITNGMNISRELSNLPANICTPSYLAAQSKLLQKKSKKIKVKSLTEAEMKKLGMGALLSVSAGSKEPACLVVMEYKGNRATRKPVVLVGKGITFDSGGISIKPSPNMDEMKYDMCGAASIIGTMHAVAELNLPINLVGIIACSENMPSGTATKPGDIVTTMSGQTVEILNTDAEGRLVLCDALTYAAKFKPDVVIDVATLTGAMIIALGEPACGVMSNNDKLALDITHAGDDIYDRAWRLPLWQEYHDSLESNFADVANIGGRAAGSIVAACFLSRFTKEYTWAHLDIAGIAWQSGKAKGATGRPVPLLMQYILNRCNK